MKLDPQRDIDHGAAVWYIMAGVTVLRNGVFRKLLGHRHLDVYTKQNWSLPRLSCPPPFRQADPWLTHLHPPYYLWQHYPPKRVVYSPPPLCQRTCKLSSLKYPLADSAFLSDLQLQPYSEFLTSLSGLIMTNLTAFHSFSASGYLVHITPAE